MNDSEFVAQLEQHILLNARLAVFIGGFAVVALAAVLAWCVWMIRKGDYDSETFGVVGAMLSGAGIVVALVVLFGHLSALIDPHGAAVASYARHRVEMEQLSIGAGR